ncbi:MAG: hypothetical protein ACRDF0_01415 [Candidatus Limnocylindria bacterium]
MASLAQEVPAKKPAVHTFERVLDVVPLRLALDGRIGSDVRELQEPLVPDFPAVVIDDDAAGTLLRGWGYCDSLAMAFVQVAERRGLRGQLLFLSNEDGVSPHAVATIKLDGEWRVFDVLTGVASRRSDGAIATPQDIASGRAASTGSWIAASWCEAPQVFYQTSRPSGVRGWIRGAAFLMADVVARTIPSVVQDLYLLTEPPSYRDIHGSVWADWRGPAERALWRARNYEVLGRLELARHAYEKVMRAPDGRFSDQARFFLYHLEQRQRAP